MYTHIVLEAMDCVSQVKQVLSVHDLMQIHGYATDNFDLIVGRHYRHIFHR